jgi:hypothetical protein
LEENALAEAAAARCDVIIADIKEIAETLATTSDKPATRNEIIAEITNMWPRTWPPLATELMARFRVNSLNFLADDMLKAVRLAIAM